MTDRGEWEYQESIKLGSHVNFASICRCYRCHKYLPDVPAIFMVRDKNILKGICPQCLENIILKHDHLITCEGCGKQFPSLFTHHWYDPKDYRQQNSRQVCQFCNAQLLAKNLWEPHRYNVLLRHVLPNWDLQRLYLNNDPDYIIQREKEYNWPLPYPDFKRYKDD